MKGELGRTKFVQTYKCYLKLRIQCITGNVSNIFTSLPKPLLISLKQTVTFPFYLASFCYYFENSRCSQRIISVDICSEGFNRFRNSDLVVKKS